MVERNKWVPLSIKDVCNSVSMEGATRILTRTDSEGNPEFLRLDRVGDTGRYQLIKCNESGKAIETDTRPRHVVSWSRIFDGARIKMAPGDDFFNYIAPPGQSCLQVYGDGERDAREGLSSDNTAYTLIVTPE